MSRTHDFQHFGNSLNLFRGDFEGFVFGRKVAMFYHDWGRRLWRLRNQGRTISPKVYKEFITMIRDVKAHIDGVQGFLSSSVFVSSTSYLASQCIPPVSASSLLRCSQRSPGTTRLTSTLTIIGI
eukprot:765268-Lingulodinium_polyedra.AAC.1